MASPSKEENILKLLLENSPLKEWHFDEIVRSAKVTRLVANKWLKKFVAEGLIRHIKEKGKFPHYTSGSLNPVYQSLKRVYALEQFHKCGFIPRLLSLAEARTIILFGSYARGDYYKDSDIDIFVFGGISDFDKHKYELKLHKKIEMHVFETQEEIDEVTTGLIRNITNGYIIKGQIQDFAKIA